MHTRPLRFLLILLASLGFRGGLPAAPDFSGSSISVSTESPPEVELVRFTLSLTNTGDTTADPAHLEIEWPQTGFFLGVEGAGNFEIDELSRKVTTSLSLPPGAERIVSVDLLPPRDSGGEALTLSLRLAHFFSGTEHWDRRTVMVDTRPPGSGVKAGAYRVTTAGLWVLGWIGLAAGIWLVVQIRMRRRNRGLIGTTSVAMALAIPIGFWMVFAGMAWRDNRALTAWPETTATIVGRRDKSQTVTSSRRSSSGVSVSSESGIVSPEFALRYEVDGETVYSTGYDTGSSIRIGGRVRREAEMRDWVRGTELPCWYNPGDPRDVIVRRGFGGAYFFALIPLPVFWIGLRMLRDRKN